MLRNLHLHYLGWRRDTLERELRALRERAAVATGMAQDRLYILIACKVNDLNPVRVALGMPMVSAYA